MEKYEIGIFIFKCCVFVQFMLCKLQKSIILENGYQGDVMSNGRLCNEDICYYTYKHAILDSTTNLKYATWIESNHQTTKATAFTHHITI